MSWFSATSMDPTEILGSVERSQKAENNGMQLVEAAPIDKETASRNKGGKGGCCGDAGARYSLCW